MRTRVLAVICVLLLGPTVRAQFFPTGFAEDVLVTVGLDRPVTLDVLPDGRILIGEHGSGRVVVFAGGHLATVGFVPGAVTNGAEDGLNALVIDPAWPTRPYVYVYYTHEDTGGNRTNRVSRFTIAGSLTDPTSPDLSFAYQYDVIDDIDSPLDHHNGGGMSFGPDGTLYLTVGDGGQSCQAQNLDSFLGKALRIDVSGLPATGPNPPPHALLVPTGNPFSGPTDVARLVFAYGLRNPFRSDFDGPTGQLVIADVGANDFEEINVAVGGENFGWPWLEGTLAYTTCGGSMPTGLFGPAVLGAHGIPGFLAITTFGGIYRNPTGGALGFGASYEGQLFYTDIRSFAPLLRVEYDGMNWVNPPAAPGQIDPAVWGTVRQPVDAAMGPDGALYYVTYSLDSLRRVKATTNATALAPASPAVQLANGGWFTPQPLTVQLTDLTGSPIQGETVTFGVTLGGGTVGPPAVTDANGFATCTYMLPQTFEGVDPVITAMHAGSNVVTFEATWRGMVLDVDPQVTPGTLSMTVRHSEAFSPVTVAGQNPSPVPNLMVSQGWIWTSILNPDAGFLLFGDGLGGLGPPTPGFVTDASGEFNLTYTGIPALGNLGIVVQAYAIDTSAPTFDEMIMIGNRLDVTLP